MIMDDFNERHRGIAKPLYPSDGAVHGWTLKPDITRTEFDALKKEVAELKELIKNFS